MAKVDIDHFAQECEKTLQDYRDVTFESLKKATDKTASETISQIKAKAPRRRGRYIQSWTSKKTMETADRYGKIVHSRKPHYRLAHLLQKGHALKGYVSKRTQLKRVQAYPHIPSDEQTEALFERNLERETEANG